MTRLIVVSLFLASAALAGCGKIGTLEQPGPMFGAQAKADYDAKQRAAADAKAKGKVKADDEPDTPTLDPNAEPPMARAPYAEPIPGGASSPSGTPPADAMPSPGVTPDQ
jgi:hypothetical protein